MAKKKPVNKKATALVSSSTLDAIAKSQVEAKVKELIDKELKPQHVEPPPEEARFNYISDITMKWHGATLYLVSVYRCPGPNALSPTFEHSFARLRPSGTGRYDLAFKRHTDQWVEPYQGQTLDECLASIRDDPFFMP